MNVRVAFCISGQIRDEALSFPGIAEVAQRLGAVVFISTWSRRGVKNSGVINRNQAARMFGVPFAQALPEVLKTGNNLNRAVPELADTLARGESEITPDDIRAHFPDAVIDLESPDLHLEFDQPGITDVNSLRMLYKIWRCNELRRRHEQQTGQRFDVVVRFRPDVVPSLTAGELRQMIDSDFEQTIHIPSAGRIAGYLDDTLAVSTGGVADWYAALFGKAMLAPRRPWQLIHSEIAAHLDEAGITARPIRIGPALLEDFDRRQPANRSTLLGLIRAGRVRAGYMASDRSWHVLGELLAGADLHAGAGPAADSLAPLTRIRFAATEAELLGRAALLAARIWQQDAAWHAAHVAAVVAGIRLLEWADGGRDGHDEVEAAVALALQAGAAGGHMDGFAIDALGQSVAALPTDSPARVLLSLAFPTDTAARITAGLARLGVRAAGSIDVLSARFHQLLNRSDFAEAGAVARQMLAQFPDDWRGIDHLGHYHAHTGDLDAALDCARRAYDMAGGGGTFAARIAQMHLARGEHAAAVARYEEAVRGWDHPLAWVPYVQSLHSLGDRRTAGRIARQALSRHPHHPELQRLATARR